MSLPEYLLMVNYCQNSPPDILVGEYQMLFFLLSSNHNNERGDLIMVRTYILLSVPDGFEQKFLNFIHNVNLLNNDRAMPIVIEKVYKKKEDYAAVPLENGENNENKNYR